MDTDFKAPLLRAAAKVGGLAQLATRLNISRSALSQWDKVPADRVVEIERLTGVSRIELRPDLYVGMAHLSMNPQPPSPEAA